MKDCENTKWRFLNDGTCAQYQLSIDVNVEQLIEIMSQHMPFDFTLKLWKEV